MAEEIGIKIETSTPLTAIRYEYPEKTIQLQLRVVHDYQGSVCGLEGQQICWLAEEALAGVDMAAADLLLLKAVSLPEYYLITGPWDGKEKFNRRLDTALQQRRKLFQLRIPGWTAAKLKPLAESAARRCHEAGAQLLINEHVELAAATEHTGIHLKSEQLMKCLQRPLPADRLTAASCHNRVEIQHACHLGLDFICLSPVMTTHSHPHAKVLGWERFEQLCRLSSLPVYALGGLTGSSLPLARRAGAMGVAGISGLWNCP